MNLSTFPRFSAQILTLTFISAVIVGCSVAPKAPEFQNDICKIFEEHPNWYVDAVDMEEKWGTPISLAMSFVKYESAFVSNARPIKKDEKGNKIGYLSSAYGYAQALDGTWGDFKKITRRRVARTDFGDALQFIGWYTSLSNEELNFDYSDVYNHYLAYHEGRGGYARGRHKGKSFLLNYAKKVAKQAQIYEEQLAFCQSDLEQKNPRNFPLFARNYEQN